MADARDTVFQASPASSALAAGVHLFEEDASQTLGTEPFNRHWVDYYFDQQTVDAVRAKPIICAGTIIGEVGPLLDLLRCVVNLATTVRRLGSRNSGGDQAILNVAVRQLHSPPVRVHRNGEAGVLNAGIMSPEKIRFDSDGWVVNAVGEVIAVVHQLDRHRSLNERLLAKLESEPGIPDTRNQSGAMPQSNL